MWFQSSSPPTDEGGQLPVTSWSAIGVPAEESQFAGFNKGWNPTPEKKFATEKLDFIAAVLHVTRAHSGASTQSKTIPFHVPGVSRSAV